MLLSPLAVGVSSVAKTMRISLHTEAWEYVQRVAGETGYPAETVASRMVEHMATGIGRLYLSPPEKSNSESRASCGHDIVQFDQMDGNYRCTSCGESMTEDQVTAAHVVYS